MVLLQVLETAQAGGDMVQKLGFPIAVAVALLVFLGYIFKTVWKYVTNKIDEKDTLLAEQTKSRKEFNDKLLQTQDRLVTGQRNIDETLQATNEHLQATNDMIKKMGCLDGK